MDSRRNGEDSRRKLDWQIRTTFRVRMRRTAVFSPGPTNGIRADTRSRTGISASRTESGPKARAGSRRGSFAEVPSSTELPWPRISVVVCS